MTQVRRTNFIPSEVWSRSFKPKLFHPFIAVSGTAMPVSKDASGSHGLLL